MRRPRASYPIPAYVYRGDSDLRFWCQVKKRRVISTDVGQEMGTTDRTLLTPSDIEFIENDMIRIGDETYTVDSVHEELDPDTNQHRKPRFIQRLEVS